MYIITTQVNTKSWLAEIKANAATASNKPMDIFAEGVSNLDAETKANVPLEDTMKKISCRIKKQTKRT